MTCRGGLNIFDRLSNWDRSSKRSIFKTLKERLLQPKFSLNKSVAMAIYILESSLNKLRQMSDGLKKRDGRFFEKCIEAQMERDRAHAVMYANECAELRKLAQIVISSELAIEQAILRLQTVEKLHNVIGAVVPIVDIVQETREKLVGVIPSVAGKLDEVSGMLNSSIREMGTASIRGRGPQPSSDEAMKVLEEANHAAEESVRERFPQLPPDLEVPKEVMQERVPVALTATGGETPQEEGQLKRQVYDYIKTCDGQLSVVQCAAYLGVFPADVEKAIIQLKEEGKVALE